MIKNIVFDMGMVLIRFDPEMFMDREGITDPEDRAILQRELFRCVEWAQMDLGVQSEKTLEPLVRARVPEHLSDMAAHLLWDWCKPIVLMEGMEDLIHRLKAAGYGIYLLSNASMNQPTYWNQLDLSRYFDGTMVSAFEHTVKPSLDIYRKFTDRFGLKPEECVFIDDLPINIAGAVENGWQGIVFHGDAAQTEAKLRELGVRF